MFSGTTNYSFDISEDGESVKLFFDWPKPMYNVEDIFKAFPSETIPNFHPKYVALENALETVRGNVDEKPKGSVEVKLPIPVQNVSSTWTKKLIESKGCTLLYLELYGFQTKYAVKNNEKLFEKDA